ncbi:MAG TPA: radical SAM protein [Planctomycetota bacterium]|nr:radical SAM protein [Planctomycetota bacterium]
MRDAAPGCEILDALHERAFRECIPLQVSLELTQRCNIRCTHCYNFDRGEARPSADPELTFDEIRALLDDLRAAGTLFVALTGGEAMMHPRFWDILDETAARNFAVYLLSNGTLLTESACDRLASSPNLWDVGLSVYGARPATHDAVTRAPGSHRRTLDGAVRLRDRGVPTALKIVVLQANAGEAADMIALAEGLGLPYLVDTTITGRYDGTSGSLATRVDSPTLEALYRGPLRPLLSEGNAHPGDEDFRCMCARGNAAVSSTGDVWPCIAAPLVAGNIRRQPFSAIWKESPVFARIRGLRRADFAACDPCGLKAWCRRSPGPAVVLHGDYTGIDPWTCREAEIVRQVLSE